VQCSNEITITITWAKNLGDGLGPHLTQSPGPRSTSIRSGILIYAAIWPQRIWAENWGAVPLFGEGRVGSPSNTPGLRPTCLPSFILICPTIWPQCTNVPDKTDRQWTDSTGRTVLQTVARKLSDFYIT